MRKEEVFVKTKALSFSIAAEMAKKFGNKRAALKYSHLDVGFFQNCSQSVMQNTGPWGTAPLQYSYYAKIDVPGAQILQKRNDFIGKRNKMLTVPGC